MIEIVNHYSIRPYLNKAQDEGGNAEAEDTFIAACIQMTHASPCVRRHRHMNSEGIVFRQTNEWVAIE